MEKEKLLSLRAAIQRTALDSHEITITRTRGMLVADTDEMVAGVAISTTNMLLSSLSLMAGSLV